MARNREGTSVHIAGVTGSSPVPPTNISAKNAMKDTGDAGSGATKDILLEIRMMFHPYDNESAEGCVLCRAADEIERLREKLKEANAAARRFLKELGQDVPLPQPPEER